MCLFASSSILVIVKRAYYYTYCLITTTTTCRRRDHCLRNITQRPKVVVVVGNHHQHRDLIPNRFLFLANKKKNRLLFPFVWKEVAICFLVIMFIATRSASAWVRSGGGLVVIHRALSPCCWMMDGRQQQLGGQKRSLTKEMNQCTSRFQTKRLPVHVLGGLHAFPIHSSHRTTTTPAVVGMMMMSNNNKKKKTRISHQLLSSSSATPSPQAYVPTEQQQQQEAAQQQQQPEYFDLIFDLYLPEGRCVGLKLKDDLPPCDALTLEAVQEQQHSLLSSSSLSLDDDDDDNQTTTNTSSASAAPPISHHWIHQKLHPDEIKFGLSLSAQAPSFWMGRLALRYALASIMMRRIESTCNDTTTDASLPAILKDPYGRPQVPAGFIGSISHKGTAGVALVAQNDDDINDKSSSSRGIGVDLESAQPRGKVDIASKVLTPQEIENLGRIPGLSREEEVLLRFSLKESLYKALHPLICQFVGFQEAQVEPAADGTAQVTLQLNSKAHEHLQDVTAHWRRVGPYFLSTCSMRLKPGCKRIEKVS